MLPAEYVSFMERVQGWSRPRGASSLVGWQEVERSSRILDRASIVQHWSNATLSTRAKHALRRAPGLIMSPATRTGTWT